MPMITPQMKVERDAQLDPGELFFAEISQVRFVGLVCSYAGPGPSRLILPLGPHFPDEIQWPTLLQVPVTAISLGSEFAIRLPVNPDHWAENEPPIDCQCLLVVGTDVFFRANGSSTPRTFAACYVNAATGEVQVRAGSVPPGQFAKPAGTPAYAISWQIVTTEPEPRVVLGYPFPALAGADERD